MSGHPRVESNDPVEVQHRMNVPSGLRTSLTAERNISAFNSDTARHGGYVYTSVERWSSRVATRRQSDGITQILTENFPPSIRIADIGCGDGAFTLEIAQRFRPESIRGIDPAELAIAAARQKVADGWAGKVSFEVGNIYDVQARAGEVAVVRGVLHHLDNPQAAIEQLGRQFAAVVALEPNGYNPGLKIIEKLSTYHRQHDEKSYWPPRLNRWFRSCGFSVVSQKFFCLVPYFCPTPLAKMLRFAEPVVEALPVVKQIVCGTNLILYKKDGARAW